MIDVTKVRMMTKLSIYEKQLGKRELRMHRYSRKNYVWIQMFICFLAVTVAYVFAVGLYLMNCYTAFLNGGTGFPYLRIFLAVFILYLILIVVCLALTSSYENKRYQTMSDHIRRYDADLEALKTYMEQEEKSSRSS